MTNAYDPDTGEPNQVTLSRRDIKRLEKQAKEGKEAQAELEQLRKERAYVQAGIPLDDRRAFYFIAGYQGEMTPEAIKAKWAADFGEATGGGNAALDEELRQLNAAQDLVTMGGAELSESRLAERNAKLDALSMSDPRYPEKFNAIFEEYGGQSAAQSTILGGQTGLPHGR